MIKVYRFNDKVAVHFEGQPTVYLEAAEAIELTKVLSRFTTDIRMRSYQDSNLSNVYIGNNND